MGYVEALSVGEAGVDDRHWEEVASAARPHAVRGTADGAAGNIDVGR